MLLYRFLCSLGLEVESQQCVIKMLEPGGWAGSVDGVEL